MNVCMGLARVRWLLASMAMLMAATLAHGAGNWEVGKQLHDDNGCATCHARKDGASIALITSAIANKPAMFNLFSAGKPQELSADNISDISAYLNHLTFPLAQLAETDYTFPSTSTASASPPQHAIRVSNGGDANLLVTGASVGSGFTADASGCTGIGGGVPPGSFCDVLVTFAPALVQSYVSTLTISYSNTFSGSSAATMRGVGLNPFTVSATLLEFTAITAPAGVLTTTITDNQGDRIRICRGASSTFSFPSDYSIDPPFALGGDGCFTSSTTSTLPRSMPLNVRFVSGGVGPRNATLTIQRVTAGGVGLGSAVNVDLHGNPGPLVNVNATSLFDDPADPGVEIDNDNTLDRSVTLFSLGSDPLVFTGTSFTITGPNADEYTLLGTGCKTLGGLPAGSVSPTPSCVLTVRFNPSGLGRRGPATLTIQIAGAPTRTVLLNGFGFFGPRLEVRNNVGPIGSGSALNFSAQTINGLYEARTLTLRNGGTLGDLEVVVPSSATTPGFTITPDAACANLAPAAQCNVAVHFDPTQAQAYTANLAFQSRKAGSGDAYDAFTLVLNGTGSASAVPVLVWTNGSGTVITSFAFGEANVGTPPSTTVRLRNDGPGGAVMSLVNAVGVGSGSFILDTSDCASGKALFENASCAVVVQFAPGSAGAKTAILQAVAAAGAPTVSVLAPEFALSGTGIGATSTMPLAVSTTALAFSATEGAQSLPLELTVTNASATATQILGYDVSTGFALEAKSCPAAPFTLAAGAQCTVTVTFHPQGAGPTQGALHVQIEGQSTTLDVALSGNAAPKADVSGGGCAIAVGDPRTDPTLWVMLLAAVCVLFARRRGAGRARTSPAVCRTNESEQ